MFSRDDIESMVARAPGAQLVFDPAGHCTFANAGFERLSGRPTRALTGTAWLDTFHADDRALVAEAWRAFVDADAPLELEARMLDANGRPAGRARVEAARFPSHDGRTVAILAHVVHLHGRGEARGGHRDPSRAPPGPGAEPDGRPLLDRLTESEERYALAVEASDEGLWDWRPSSGELWCSEHLLELLGMPRADFGGHLDDLAAHLHADDRSSFSAALDAHLKRRVPLDVVCRTAVGAGRPRWVRVRGQASWDAEGRPSRVVGVLADVTAQVEMQLEVEGKTQELERNNAELERFASVASHDLKEPLRKIRSFCDRLFELGKIEDARSLDYLRRMRRAADHLHQMVGELLEVARVPVQARERVPVELSAVVAGVLEGLAGSIAEAGARIDVQPLPRVCANRMHMEQVFANLLENALKYRAPERPLVVRLFSSVDEASARGRIEVEDNGIGFDQAQSERIFVLFERLHGRAYPGTGLGLALCRRIVEEHGGRIDAHGRLGHGARFVVELPLDRR